MTTLPEGPAPSEEPGAGAPGAAASPTATAADAVLAEAGAVLEQAEEQQPGSLEDLDRSRRLLLVHAHPDDETISNGVTMARYAAEGVQVTLVTCTLGEEGEVLVPELAHLAADRDDGLGAHRISELATAMEALGVTDHRFLGGPGRYRDSGMMGTPSNDRPDCFWQAELDEAATALVEVVREVRPQVVVTYDDNGGYGHPDHIQAHRVTMRALELAADPAHGSGAPWQVAKVYAVAVPRSVLVNALRALREAGDQTSFGGMDPEGELPSFVVPDEEATTRIDGPLHLEAKMAAMRAHATQIQVDGGFFALSNSIGMSVLAEEYYRLMAGRLGERDGPDGRETDLFSGVA